MDAGMLACPGCGAPTAPSKVSCDYCRAQLATVACAGCLGMNFVGSQHCVHCGAKIFRPANEVQTAGTRACPRCRTSVLAVSAVGDAFLEECGRCGGLWVDVESFKKICARREQRAAFVGLGSPVPSPGGAVAPHAVKYIPCPDCGKVMNRVNFARCSGVVVDVCKSHGTWFDADELRQILTFIQDGGLEEARRREVEQLRRENAVLRERGQSVPFGGDDEHPYRDAIGAASELIGWLLK